MTLVENNQTAQPQVETKSEQPQVAKPNTKKPGRVLQPKSDEVALLQPLAEGETMNRSTEYVKPKVARDTFAFRLVDKGPRYVKTVDFDFNGCSEEEILNLALKSARIDLQSKLRALGEKSRNPELYKTCNVKLDLLTTGTREPVDPQVAAVRRLMTALDCSEAEAQAIVDRELAKRAK